MKTLDVLCPKQQGVMVLDFSLLISIAHVGFYSCRCISSLGLNSAKDLSHSHYSSLLYYFTHQTLTEIIYVLDTVLGDGGKMAIRGRLALSWWNIR